MDDYSDHEKHFDDLLEVVFTAYRMMARLFDALPIPIRLDPRVDEWDGPQLKAAILALDRVRRTLIDDQPIREDDKGPMKTMILDWITAFELCASTAATGADPWRVDAIDWTCERVSNNLLALAQRYLDG